MSLITVQLGQCGNQIGYELFDVLCSDLQGGGLCPRREDSLYQAASKERFFDETESGDLVGRAVLLDMEAKVISRTLSMATRSSGWRYCERSQFSQKQGSGNNWANGYYVHGPKHKDSLMDLVRKEVEKCDRLAGFIPIMSMAGGTGSGMGTFITRALRDVYSKSLLLNEVIWPYGTGEVIVQNYNSVLTLSHLYQCSDALLVHENDIIHRVCSQRMNIKQISFRDVNQVIAHQLGSVFQPAYTAQGAWHYSRNPLGNLLESLVPHPEYKMLGLRTIPQMSERSLAYSTFTWPGLLKHLRQMLIANAEMEEGINWRVQLPSETMAGRNSVTAEQQFNKSVANLVIFRGKDLEEASPEGFRDPALYTSWLPPENSFSIWKTSRAFNKYEKSATLMSNSQSLLRPLDNVVGKAWNMFASRAYVHQYTKYGMEEEDFLQSFTTLEQVISSYSTL
ncbi:tubulin delta chain [Dendropsophus ebraccatus]|uniref:tubulin delta chain n=1 Tax=Dendropsophus ebraccatus TaxID=150705 RepID=UPI003831F22B